MKKTLVLMAAFVVAIVAVGQELASTSSLNPAPAAAIFTWNGKVFDFGQIQRGTPVTHEFSFTNTGNDVLVISSVQASCGCTVTDYSKDPIPAGGKGYVKATYNAANPGAFSKTVTIHANTDESTVVLTIKGEVVE
jgi:hypothetical protein